MLSKYLAKTTTLAALLLGTLLLCTWSESKAIPAFARQTGMACVTCHTQTFPGINTFGRSFKSGGYTLIGAQEQVIGDDLSLPVVLNASLVTKFRFQKTNGDDSTGSAGATNSGQLQFPDEAALLIGGRAGEHVGFVLELATFGEADGGGEFSLFGSFKMPITYKVGGVDLSVVPFTTDAGGAGYGFELLNTGAQRFQRVGEDRKAMMAQQYLNLGAGAAEGFAFVASHEMGFVNVSLWAPRHGTISVRQFAPYFRAAWTPSIGGMDLGLGIQYYLGQARELNTTTGLDDTLVTKGFAIDAQLQGEVVGMPLGVYAAFGSAPSKTVFNTGSKDKNAWSIHVQLGVLPKTSVLLGYLSADTGADSLNKDNAFTVGATYLLAQNVQIQLNQAIFHGSRYEPKQPAGTLRTTLMLFSAF